jgi:hypothetical protein
MKSGSSAGYCTLRVAGTIYSAHRLAWFYVHGEWPPKGIQVDHINRDPSDNRLANLRLATQAQNNANSAMRHRNKAGLKGVVFYPMTSRWKASITIKGRGKHLGYFATKEEAHEAYKKAAQHAHGEFARFD